MIRSRLNKQHLSLFCFISLFLGLLGLGPKVYAEEIQCAEVKIEIAQELTLERQAFEAKMRITNALDTIALENLMIEVLFSDVDGNPVLASSDTSQSNAKFFYRVDDTNGINAIDGTDSLAPASVAEIRWLIIPASNASDDNPQGTLYLVGATVSYEYGGIEQLIEVAPDSIIVKPQPQLSLNYFIESEVFGDDAFTAVIEPPIPFSLGVRVFNGGAGAANAVSIDSAQPKIIENEQGLAVGFEIVGSYVQDKPVTSSLLLNFADIPPASITTGRWLMKTTLSGKFIDFSATFNHADEYGGQLTSLLDSVHTHFLIGNVLVDLDGRDKHLDFLALDGEGLRVFESEATGLEAGSCMHCTMVADYSDMAALSETVITGDIHNHTLSFNATPGASYVKVLDPYQGQKGIVYTHLSNGKAIPHVNVWLSKERAANKIDFNYFLNLFDANSSGNYVIGFADQVIGAQAPVIQFIADRESYEGSQIGFLVRASDPNGDAVGLNVSDIPSGASFKEHATNGESGLVTYVFSWFPVKGQAGEYTVNFSATDGVLSSSQAVLLKVNPFDDTDGDGLLDTWEIHYFGDLSHDGSDDTDNDGYSDHQEFINQTDPTVKEAAPGAPEIKSPLFDEEVQTLTPTLIITNGIHGTDDTVSYEIEIYSDLSLTQMLGSGSDVAEGDQGQTSQIVDETFLLQGKTIADNAWYYWRARTVGAEGNSAWVNARFFVNTKNDPPGYLGVNSPEDGVIVQDYQPTLIVDNSSDVDHDTLSYSFYISDLQTPNEVLASVEGIQAGQHGVTAWKVPVELEENHHYQWYAGVSDEHDLSTQSEKVSFLVSQTNDEPNVPGLQLPPNKAEIVTLTPELTVNNSIDPEGQPLVYWFEIDTSESFDSSDFMASSSVNEGDETTTWQFDELKDNTKWYWRVRASDGETMSPWAVSTFFVNIKNEAPTQPVIDFPDNGVWVESLSPTLAVHPSDDIDQDEIQYQFELYDQQQNLLVTKNSQSNEWQVDLLLSDNTNYYWRARAIDEHDLASDWTNQARFFVNEDGADDKPVFNFVLPSTEIEPTDGEVIIQWTDADVDSNARISLYYNDSIEIVTGIEEDLDGMADQYTWNVLDLEPGSYLIYAIIEDNSSSIRVNACCNVIIPDPYVEREIVVTQPSSLIVDEYGLTTLAFDVSLTAPLEEGTSLTLNFNTSDETEGAIINEMHYLYFTDENWQTPQTIIIKGQDDCNIDGDQAFVLSFQPAVSQDVTYAGLQPSNITIINQDNEQIGQLLFICDYRLQSQTTLPDGNIKSTLKVMLTNTGPALDGAIAILTLLDPNVELSSSSTVSFPFVFKDEKVESQQSIHLISQPLSPLDYAKFKWQITPGNIISVLEGTKWNDRIIGTKNNDYINGLAGNDLIFAGAGDDVIIGGPGSDWIYGGDGNDQFVITGNDPYSDIVIGGRGYDTVVGSNADDSFRFKWFHANYQVEEINGRLGSNIIYGDNGKNFLDFRSTTLINIALIDALAGNDVVHGSKGPDVIKGGIGSDRIYGHQGDDIFLVEGNVKGFDIYSGGRGDDKILGSDANDFIKLFEFSGSNTVEIIDGGEGNNYILGSHFADILDFSNINLINIKHINGKAGRDKILGTSQPDTIIGGQGNDELYGNDGDDTFVIYGKHQGIDYINGGLGHDSIVGSAYDDRIQFNTFDKQNSIEAIDGKGGYNVIVGDRKDNLLDFSNTTLTNINRIYGADGNDHIVGSNNSDYLAGQKGRNILSGRLGGDIYQIDYSKSCDMIDEQGSLKDQDQIYFNVNENISNIRFTKINNDLLVYFKKSHRKRGRHKSSCARIKGWFHAESQQIELFKVRSGSTIKKENIKLSSYFEAFGCGHIRELIAR